MKLVRETKKKQIVGINLEAFTHATEVHPAGAVQWTAAAADANFAIPVRTVSIESYRNLPETNRFLSLSSPMNIKLFL